MVVLSLEIPMVSRIHPTLFHHDDADWTIFTSLVFFTSLLSVLILVIMVVLGLQIPIVFLIHPTLFHDDDDDDDHEDDDTHLTTKPKKMNNNTSGVMCI